MALIFLFVRLRGHRSSLMMPYWRINKRWTKVYFFASDWTNCLLCAGCPWQTVGITKKSPSKAGGLLNPRSGVLRRFALSIITPPLRSVDYCSAASLCRLLLRNFRIPSLSEDARGRLSSFLLIFFLVNEVCY